MKQPFRRHLSALASDDLVFERCVRAARELKSEHGENPEYDRALVELTAFAAGLTAEFLSSVANELGIDLPDREAEDAG